MKFLRGYDLFSNAFCNINQINFIIGRQPCQYNCSYSLHVHCTCIFFFIQLTLLFVLSSSHVTLSTETTCGHLDILLDIFLKFKNYHNKKKKGYLELHLHVLLLYKGDERTKCIPIALQAMYLNFKNTFLCL